MLPFNVLMDLVSAHWHEQVRFSGSSSLPFWLKDLHTKSAACLVIWWAPSAIEHAPGAAAPQAQLLCQAPLLNQLSVWLPPPETMSTGVQHRDGPCECAPPAAAPTAALSAPTTLLPPPCGPCPAGACQQAAHHRDCLKMQVQVP